jgi:uncharacterized protein DUF4339
MASQLSASPPLWHWAVDGDEPQTGTEDELIRQLSTGRLPPYALVWREGWGEWLPAMQVEVLADAFPDVSAIGTRTARPSSIPGVPPVPVSDYPRLRHLAKGAPLGWPDGFEGPEQEIITAEVPEVALIEAARAMTQPNPPLDLGLRQAVERASRAPQQAPFFPREEDQTPISKSALPLAAEYGLEKLIEDATPRRNWAFWLRAHGLWVALLAIALGLGATFALRWFGLERRPPRSRATSGAALSTPGGATLASTVSSAPVLEPAPSAAGCSSLHAPIDLDDWAVVDVRPVIHGLPGGKAVVIGYAQSHRSAAGIRLELESLHLTRQFLQEEEHQVFSVTPLVGKSVTDYHVERQGSAVAFGRALDMAQPVRLGMGDEGVVLGAFDQPAAKLWELPPGSAMSVPEVSSNPHGFTVAVRAARGIGHLRVGLLNAAGQALSPFAQLGDPQWDFGRPSLASGPEQTAVVACRRGRGQEPDALLMARAHNGQLPRELEPFALPGPEPAELMAPVLAALPDGGFVLMWSQGESARRQVRLQRLSSALAPIGAPFDVTSAEPPEGGGATAAALHVEGDRLLAFYFVRREAGHSLWVASVSCGV